MKLNIPEIYTKELAVFPIDKNTPVSEVLELLEKGHFILIEDFYSTGLNLLSSLKREIKGLESKNFNESREARKSFRTLSHQILLEVENHVLLVRKAPEIPWLKKFYPKEDYFAISFPDIQALNSSWQWYERGLKVPGLLHKINPWYGVYFPTRFEHIEVFNEYLSHFEGEKNKAYDIGCGSGILSFLLEQKGFKSVLATDINPNAIISMQEEVKRHDYKNIQIKKGNTFAGLSVPAELIVFNPPWLPETANNSQLDKAMYYDQSLFDEFFEQADQRLKPEGKLVLLFSNLAKLTHPDIPHPVEEELTTNKRFQLDKLLTKPVSKGSDKTKRDTSRRVKEQVELWVLKHKA